MTCSDFEAVVEPAAAGEAELTPAQAEHLAGCPPCAARLALARRIEGTLATRPAPEPPPRFTAAVLGRVRGERWRAEQRIDRVFNLAIAAAVVLLAAGVWMLFNLSGVAEIGGQTSQLLRENLRTATEGVAAQLPAYVGGTGLLLSAVGVWWWAERAH